MMNALKIIVLLILTGTLCLNESLGQQNPFDDIEKTVVFIGEIDLNQNPKYLGTGFIVNINNRLHVVTAKHIIMEKKNGMMTDKILDTNLVVFFNDFNKKLRWRSFTKIKKIFNVEWIFHNNNNVDEYTEL